jgi:hypothetical protein
METALFNPPRTNQSVVRYARPHGQHLTMPHQERRFGEDRQTVESLRLRDDLRVAGALKIGTLL